MDSPAPFAGSDAEQLPRRCAILQRQVNVLTFVLLVLAGSVGIFMLRQVQLAGRNADNIQSVGQQMLANYQGQLEPRALLLERELRQLGATRPALGQFMARFANSDAPATNSPPAAP